MLNKKGAFAHATSTIGEIPQHQISNGHGLFDVGKGQCGAMAYYAIIYEKGGRESNQDSIALHRMQTRMGILSMALVCDGMGGEACGELASGYAAEEISRWFYDALPRQLVRDRRKKAIGRSLSRQLFRVHEALRSYGARHDCRTGTTMTLLLVLGAHYMVFQLGDSMAYRMARRGSALTRRQAEGSRVARCLGIGRYYAPDMRCGRVRGRMAFLLASDGLTHCVKEQELFTTLSPQRLATREDAQRSLKTLAAAAQRRGETDNISAIYLAV